MRSLIKRVLRYFIFALFVSFASKTRFGGHGVLYLVACSKRLQRSHRDEMKFENSSKNDCSSKL